jgi:hypothetical protein
MMFEGFKTAFAASWGLIAAVLSFVLIVGLSDAVGGIVKTARIRHMIKRRLAD